MSVRGCYQCMREAKVTYVCDTVTDCYKWMREANTTYVCERLLPMYEGG